MKVHTNHVEILKQPVHTSVAIDKKDFDEFLAEDNLHIALNLKDFKAAIAHAETANALLTARYTRPCRPLQLAYEFEGVKSEFTLMTRGEANNDNNNDAPTPSRDTARQSLTRQTQPPAQVNRANSRAPESRPTPIPPPRAPAPAPAAPSAPVPAAVPRNRPIRPIRGTPSTARGSIERNPENERPPAASMDFDSLFVPADDDRQWDVPNDEEEPEEDILGWDATGEQVSQRGFSRTRAFEEMADTDGKM